MSYRLKTLMSVQTIAIIVGRHVKAPHQTFIFLRSQFFPARPQFFSLPISCAKLTSMGEHNFAANIVIFLRIDNGDFRVIRLGFTFYLITLKLYGPS